MAAAALSLVIPSLNGERRLATTLESVAVQRVRGDLEVVVVDDGSSDATSRTVLAAALPWGPARVVRHEEPRGRASACNSGIEAARAPIVVILDDDMDLQPGALEAHREFHDARPGRAAIGRILQSAPPEPSCFSRFLDREEANRERLLLRDAGDVPWHLCLTGHFSAARETIVGAGGFDARIRRYGFEDIELAYRLSTRGVRIAYLPAAVSVHRAYMTELERYVSRHFEAGIVARDLAARYAQGPFREFLRVDGPPARGGQRIRPGLAALRLSNRLLLIRPLRGLLASRPGRSASRALLRAAEAAGLERIAHFGYHVVRDLAYFRGYFGEGRGA